MAMPYERQTNITKLGEVTQKPQTTENTSKSPKNSYKDFMDKSETLLYNNGKENTSLSDTLLSQNWKEKNKDSMRYAGDSAKKSIDAGLKEALDFMRDADESTSLEDVQSASVKRKLANDSNNTELARKATMELIGHFVIG